MGKIKFGSLPSDSDSALIKQEVLKSDEVSLYHIKVPTYEPIEELIQVQKPVFEVVEAVEVIKKPKYEVKETEKVVYVEVPKQSVEKIEAALQETFEKIANIRDFVPEVQYGIKDIPFIPLWCKVAIVAEAIVITGLLAYLGLGG